MAVNCSDPILPVVAYDYCDPEILFGEISMIRWTRPGDSLTDVTDLAEWEGRISNSAAIPVSGLWPIRELPVSAEMGEPDVTESEISGGRKVYSTPKYKIPFESTDFNTANLAFVRAMQAKPGTTVALWFESPGLIWGGDNGVTANVKITAVIPKSRTELCTIKGEFSFEQVLPESAASPFQ
jgi:hypothetical protein